MNYLAFFFLQNIFISVVSLFTAEQVAPYWKQSLCPVEQLKGMRNDFLVYNFASQSFGYTADSIRSATIIMQTKHNNYAGLQYWITVSNYSLYRRKRSLTGEPDQQP